MSQPPTLPMSPALPKAGLALPRARSAALALGFVAASLLWLSLSSRLTAAGQRIAEMEQERKTLAESWISAVARHNKATDPLRLRQRAAALGFQPAQQAEQLWLTDPRALSRPRTDEVDLSLGTARRAAQLAAPEAEAADFGGLLLDLGVAEGASAAMLQTDHAP